MKCFTETKINVLETVSIIHYYLHGKLHKAEMEVEIMPLQNPEALLYTQHSYLCS